MLLLPVSLPLLLLLLLLLLLHCRCNCNMLLTQGYEVMYLTDVLDEYVMQQLTEFEDFKFVNIAKEDVDTSAEAEGEVSTLQGFGL
jgi:hypothetical protein